VFYGLPSIVYGLRIKKSLHPLRDEGFLYRILLRGTTRIVKRDSISFYHSIAITGLPGAGYSIHQRSLLRLRVYDPPLRITGEFGLSTTLKASLWRSAGTVEGLTPRSPFSLTG